MPLLLAHATSATVQMRVWRTCTVLVGAAEELDSLSTLAFEARVSGGDAAFTCHFPWEVDFVPTGSRILKMAPGPRQGLSAVTRAQA